MSDYIYMLESHLDPRQNRIVRQVQAAAAQANLNLFLTGGAMRDIFAGARIRDLDFVVEGDALRLADAVANASGAAQVAVDVEERSVELVFPEGATAQIASTRARKLPGRRKTALPATIQEDLRSRDLACNAIALSLNRASRGLLLDPLNGLADIERRELRSVDPYVFYDDPTRLFRLERLRIRLGFAVEERTRTQATNTIAAGSQDSIPAKFLGEELKRIAAEDSPSEILRALEEVGLLALFSPALVERRLNHAGLVKFEKCSQILPADKQSAEARFPVFLCVLTEKLSAREQQALVKAAEIPKDAIGRWQKLAARARKLELSLRAARIRKASQVFHIVSAAQPDEALFLLQSSSLRAVQERLRNYYQKYLPAVQEIPAAEWSSVEGKPGTPKHQKARREFIARRLDRRPPKPPSPEVSPAVVAAPVPANASLSRSWRTPHSAVARRARSAY